MNDTLDILKFDTRTDAELVLVRQITDALVSDIEKLGRASLLVSGGSTPLALFESLSKVGIEWSKVTITLVDDRVLPDWHKDLNGRMVKEKLVINKAIDAQFIPLVTDPNDKSKNLKDAVENLSKIPQPFSVVVLGMGEDGHTASLFAGSETYEQAMDLDSSKDLFNVTPIRAPYDRISFGRRKLLEAKRLFLHFYGKSKMETLNSALEATDYKEYPIAGFLQATNKIQTIWAQ